MYHKDHYVDRVNKFALLLNRHGNIIEVLEHLQVEHPVLVHDCNQYIGSLNSCYNYAIDSRKSAKSLVFWAVYLDSAELAVENFINHGKLDHRVSH